eukprot:TRINITY_DN65687_c0_g1_i1.p2 TRINITY_DN65687_c0_g1~~TRINITY_DN65687_c0_g1_i1.p2  ORF type:complete len:734 (+),score=134.11 TRINITY_DN65687_c0_g1_i1:39-2240(+)
MTSASLFVLFAVCAHYVSAQMPVIHGRFVHPNPPIEMQLWDIAQAKGTFCTVNRDGQYILSWNATMPKNRVTQDGNAVFGSEARYRCNNAHVTSNGDNFFLYFESCIRFVWISTDCHTWTKTKNPLIFDTYSNGAALVAGKKELLFLTDEYDAWMCPATLMGGAEACTEIKEVPYHNEYNHYQNSFYSMERDAFFLWNSTTIVELTSMSRMTHSAPPTKTKKCCWDQYSFATYMGKGGKVVGLFLASDHDNYQYGDVYLFSTTDFMKWTTVKQWQMEGSYVFADITTSGTMILRVSANNCGNGGCPTIISHNAGKTFKTLNATKAGKDGFLTGPYDVAHTEGMNAMFAGIGFTLDPAFDDTVIVGGAVTADAWSPVITAIGPRKLYPIVSLLNNTMLWGVERTKSPCNSRIWVSYDGVNWKLALYLANMTIPNKMAYEFPKGSGQVVALMHDCSIDGRASGNYGDLWFFPKPGMKFAPPVKAVLTPAAIGKRKALFHAVGYGLTGEIVAIGYPYGGDDGSEEDEDDLWFAYSTNGRAWSAKNISSETPSECKFTYIAGLEIIGTSKAIAYNAEATQAICYANNQGFVNFHVSAGSRRLGQFAAWEDYMIASTDASARDMFYSMDGSNWHGLKRTNDTYCVGRSHSGHGPNFGLYNGYVIVGGSDGQLCGYELPANQKMFNGMLNGIILPIVDDDKTVTADPSSFGVLNKGMETTIVMNTDDNKLLLYSYTRSS